MSTSKCNRILTAVLTFVSFYIGTKDVFQKNCKQEAVNLHHYPQQQSLTTQCSGLAKTWDQLLISNNTFLLVLEGDCKL